jgi:chorismate-pyruvate lyase
MRDSDIAVPEMSSRESESATMCQPSWTELLAHFYSRRDLPLPRLEAVSDSQIPAPYQGLLVHARDMTPALENFYGQAMRISLLSSEKHNNLYLREVVLTGAQDERPVEYGAIRIYLAHLPEQVVRSVLEEKNPFGKILQEEAVPHFSSPAAFFRSEVDSHISSMLDLGDAQSLYGRHNRILHEQSGLLLAEVTEILASADPYNTGK